MVHGHFLTYQVIGIVTMALLLDEIPKELFPSVNLTWRTKTHHDDQDFGVGHLWACMIIFQDT